jgi:ABC-type transporter Mla maintaining outer membrane lipid asymmetry ATPase subunit MlaF
MTVAAAAVSDARASLVHGSTGEPVIAVRGLGKRYGRLDAVFGVDLEVYRGEIFALLGPERRR